MDDDLLICFLDGFKRDGEDSDGDVHLLDGRQEQVGMGSC